MSKIGRFVVLGFRLAKVAGQCASLVVGGLTSPLGRVVSPSSKFKAMLIISAVGAASFPAYAEDNLPSGALWATPSGTGPGNFSINFTASSTDQYVGFAFRQDPAYWAFDNVSLTVTGQSTNLLTNGNFDTAQSVTTPNGSIQAPTGWGVWYQNGIVPSANGVLEYGVWVDGSVGSYDGIYQGVALTIGTQYTISFSAEPNKGTSDQTTADDIRMGVYVGACNGVAASCVVPNSSGFFPVSTPGGTYVAPPSSSSDIDTAPPAGGYLASNLGNTVNAVFRGGTLKLDGGAGTAYTQNFDVQAANGYVDPQGVGQRLTGVSSGAGGLTFANSAVTRATVTLEGANTYSGGTTVESNTNLALSGAGALNSSGVVTVNSGGRFAISSASGNRTIGGLQGAGDVDLGARNLELSAANHTFSGVMSGSGGLRVSAGTQSLTGSNTYTGSTEVEAGATLSINSGNAVGGTSGINLNGTPTTAATIQFTGGGAYTVSRPFSVSGDPIFDVTTGTTTTISSVIADGGAPGDVEKIGAGTLILTGANTYSAGTIVTAGVLQVANDGNLGDANGFVRMNGGTLQAGASFDLAATRAVSVTNASVIDNNGYNVGISSAITGSAGLTTTGSGILTLSGNNSGFSGGITVADGTLSLQNDNAAGTGTITTTGSVIDYANGVTISNPIVINSNTTQLQTLAGVTATQAGAISELSGPRPLEKVGSGTLILTGTNTYSGTTTISAGTLQVGDGGTGGTLGTGNVVNNSTLVFNRSDNITVANAVSGTGALTQSGAGTLNLSGTSTYTGATTIDAGGTIALTGTGSIANSSVVTANGGFDISGRAGGSSIVSLAGSGTVALGSQNLTLTNAADTFSGVIGGAGALTVAGGSQTLTGVNTYTGGTTVNSGAALTLAGGGSVTGSINGGSANGGTLNIGDIAGLSPSTFVDSGAGRIGGTATLAALNINSGSSFYAANGANIGAQTVTNAGLLDMTGGAIQLPSLVASVSGNYVQTADAIYRVNIGSSINPTTQTNSQLQVANNISLDGTLDVNGAAGSRYYAGQVFTVMTYGGSRTGAFAGVTENIDEMYGYVDYSNAGSVRLVLMPELNVGTIATGSYSSGTNLNQLASGTTQLSNGNTVSTSGGASSIVLPQTASNSLNQVGTNAAVAGFAPTTSVSPNAGFSITQSAGPASVAYNQDSYSQTGSNQVSASGGSVGLVQGAASQSAQGAVNTVSLSTAAGATGTLVQATNALVASGLSSSNQLSATSTRNLALAGAASGTSTTQAATNALNVASVAQAGDNTIGLQQSLGATQTARAASNPAHAANSGGNTASLSALVSRVNQVAGLSSNVYEATGGGASLTGGQNGTTTAFIQNQNQASASASLGNAAVDYVTQNTALSISSLASSGSLALGSSADSFQQNIQRISNISLGASNPTGPGPSSVTANTISSAATAGDSRIVADASTTTQRFDLGLNTVNAAGAVSGGLAQSVAGLGLPSVVNTAQSTTTNGGARIDGISQVQSQSLNLVSAGGGLGGGASQQLSAPVSLGAENLQSAITAGGTSIVNGANQASTFGMNVANIGTIGSSPLLQTASGSTLVASNGVTSQGTAAVIASAAQSSVMQINVAR